MILPIISYGHPVLRKKAERVTKDYKDIDLIIANMYDTMYHASGVGLAAPQVGLAIRIFVVDGAAFEEDEVASFKKTFINPEIIEESGDAWKFNEGCLSIPGIREDVNRLPEITLQYQDEEFNEHTETFKGMAARIIQHEYDHIEGVLFTDHISPLRRRLLKKKLTDITKGKVDVDYRMKFPQS